MCAAQSCNKPTNDRVVALGHSKVGCELFLIPLPFFSIGWDMCKTAAGSISDNKCISEVRTGVSLCLFRPFSN